MSCNGSNHVYVRGSFRPDTTISRIYNLIDREIAITKWPLLYFTWSGTSLNHLSSKNHEDFEKEKL